MKLKLTRSEFIALHDLFKKFVVVDHSTSSAHVRLQLAVLQELWERIYKQFIYVKPSYSITLSPAECIAFFLFFSNNHNIPPHLVFEINLINQINYNIHKNLLL